jgi:hypothetical protein
MMLLRALQVFKQSLTFDFSLSKKSCYFLDPFSLGHCECCGWRRCLLIGKESANVLNKQTLAVDKKWVTYSEVDRGADNSRTIRMS